MKTFTDLELEGITETICDDVCRYRKEANEAMRESGNVRQYSNLLQKHCEVCVLNRLMK